MPKCLSNHGRTGGAIIHDTVVPSSRRQSRGSYWLNRLLPTVLVWY